MIGALPLSAATRLNGDREFFSDFVVGPVLETTLGVLQLDCIFLHGPWRLLRVW